MAIKAKDDLLKYIKEHTKDDTSDETLGFIADFTDTFNDLEAKSKDSTDWKQKYEANDKEWRQKYRDRFFESTPKTGDDGKPSDPADPDPDPTVHNDDAPKTYDDLFTHEKK